MRRSGICGLLLWSMLACTAETSKPVIPLDEEMAPAVVTPPPAACLKLGEKTQPLAAVGSTKTPPANPCCESMRPIESIDGCGNAYGSTYIGVCAACGDGTCDEKLENSCNCSEDCGPSNVEP